MHANHSTNPLTIWHDGCAECTARADRLPDSINDLDDRNRVRAWHYMRAYKWSGGDWRADAPLIQRPQAAQRAVRHRRVPRAGGLPAG